MFIEQRYAKIALDNAEAKMNEAEIIFDKNALNTFKDTLKTLSKTSKYQEGAPMYQTDLNLIKKHMGKLYESVADNFAKQSEEYKKETGIKDYVLAAHDYLVALTMKEMNSPYIANGAFKDVLDTFSNKMIQAQPTNKVWMEDVIKAQRYTNADRIVSGKVGYMMEQVESGKFYPEQLRDVFAEYKALQHRQQNHNAIWRWFHRKENDARNDLLKKMEDVMKTQIPAEDFAKMETPEDVMRYQTWTQTNKSIDLFVARREAMPEMDFGYYKYQADPDLYDKYMKDAEQKENERLSEQLKEATTDKVSDKSEYKQEPPLKSAPNKEI